MKTFNTIIFSLLLCLINSYSTFSQSYKLEVQITNLPGTQIILGTIMGDKFTPTDSFKVQPSNILQLAKKAVFTFSDSSRPGIYRLVFGQTTYAKIMNEPPQQLDFIYNKENIMLETDFKAPEDSLQIILSEENRLWFAFLEKEKEFQQKLKELEMEVSSCQSSDLTNQNCAQLSTSYNQLQMERDLYITRIIKLNPTLFAVRLIELYREPILDGFLTARQRKEIFKTRFFKFVDFNDDALIHSSVYTDKVFKYLVGYVQKGLPQEQRERELMMATDIILGNILQYNYNSEGLFQSEAPTKNKVYKFTLEYLIHGFEVLKLDNVLTYIAEKYPSTLPD